MHFCDAGLATAWVRIDGSQRDLFLVLVDKKGAWFVRSLDDTALVGGGPLPQRLLRAGENGVPEPRKLRNVPPVYPADLTIEPDAHGRPVLRSEAEPGRTGLPAVSIAHTEGVAVGLACRDPGAGVGVDVERVVPRSPAFEGLAFTDEERALLDRVSSGDRDSWIARLWCAKEAAAKALGTGLGYKPRDLVIRKIDESTGTIAVEVGGEIARQRPDHAGHALEVHTRREGDLVWATCTCTGSDA